MAWWNGRRKNASPSDVSTEPSLRELTAAAHVVQSVKAGRTRITPKYDGWQKELWDYYDTLGEFNISVSWRSYMMSRVRLRAAKLIPGSDEPEIVETGPAADLVNELMGGTHGQTAMLGTLSTFLDVPGEGWLVGENIDGKHQWRVMSSDEIRRRGATFDIISDDSYEGSINWRSLGLDSYVTRIWRPHKRLHYLAYSPAYAARSAMRELELVNRHIQSTYLSRIASAGLIVFPDEITFPVRPEFQDAPDPFIREWIETAAEAIKNPGSASAIIPLPIRVPAEYVEKVKHVDFTLKADLHIIQKRDSARNRLAAMINVPADLLFQAGDVNHWGLWQLEEGAIRTYITPDAEIITDAFTKGYLHPRLKAAGEDPTDWVVWADASELMVRPDKSENAVKAYDRMELSGKALRRETGFGEEDAPVDDELNKMILKKLAINPTLAFLALGELTGLKIEPPPAPVVAPPNDGSQPSVDKNQQPPAPTPTDTKQGPPKTQDNKPPAPAAPAAAESNGGPDIAFTILQAKTRHIIEFSLDGYKLKHPQLCQPKLFSCPFTHATYDGVEIRPGKSGNYECYLNHAGNFVIGQRVFTREEELISNPVRSISGARRGA